MKLVDYYGDGLLRAHLKIRLTKRRDLQCQRGHRIKPGQYVEREGMFGSKMFYCPDHSREEGMVQ